ncbi:MAG TPA: alpha/beta fold hydrolase [Gemmatimonadaceae bacterium]|nr:alpha/beta fold hydrolase [Gemmatimonadaceae bacterium]
MVNSNQTAPFVPAWWIRGPHAQTLWGKLARATPLPPTGRTERWDTPDGDFVDLFRVPTPVSAAASTPHLVVLHGLEGTLRSHYARGIFHRAVAAGWAVDFLLFRGCGAEANRAPRFYHSGDTGDLAFVVRRIVVESPAASIFLVGYSLGGNVLLKWLGEQGAGTAPGVRAAAAVSVPYDLERGARYINQGFSKVYERHFLRTLKAKAAAKLLQFPGLFDAGALAAATTIVDFDDAVTAPVHGFASAHDYYSRSSSLHFLSRIHLPTLLLSAYDDPFLPADVLEHVAMIAHANPALRPMFSPRGGHVGFVSGSIPGRPQYSSEDRLMAFFRAHVDPTGG